MRTRLRRRDKRACSPQKIASCETLSVCDGVQLIKKGDGDSKQNVGYAVAYVLNGTRPGEATNPKTLRRSQHSSSQRVWIGNSLYSSNRMLSSHRGENKSRTYRYFGPCTSCSANYQSLG